MGEALTVEQLVSEVRAYGGLEYDSRWQPRYSAVSPVGLRLRFDRVDGEGVYPAFIRLRAGEGGEVLLTGVREIVRNGDGWYRIRCRDRLLDRELSLVFRAPTGTADLTAKVGDAIL